MFVVRNSLFPVRSLSFYSLLSKHTTTLFDSGGTVKGSPIRPPQCGLPRNVSRSASTMNSYGAVIILRSLRDSLRSEWFPVYASLMLFRHPSHPWVVRLFVGNAVPSATFNDLANTSAKLGNYFWLGFIIMGLSPDKKRHALHGAQRLVHQPLTGKPDSSEAVERLQTTHRADKLKERSAVRCDVLLNRAAIAAKSCLLS